jgi:hypothetical protein
MTNDESI